MQSKSNLQFIILRPATLAADIAPLVVHFSLLHYFLCFKDTSLTFWTCMRLILWLDDAGVPKQRGGSWADSSGVAGAAVQLSAMQMCGGGAEQLPA